MRDFYIIVPYFNTAEVPVRRHNLERFLEALPAPESAGVVLVEGVSSKGSSFSHDRVDSHLEVHTPAHHSFWLQEQLINIGIRSVPPECEFVAVVDADVIFSNREWISEARQKLSESPVAQLYQWVVRLPEGVAPGQQLETLRFGHGEMRRAYAIAHAIKSFPRVVPELFGGATGFAWGMHRTYFKNLQFFDCLPMTGADVITVYAWCFGDQLLGRLDCYRSAHPEMKEKIRSFSVQAYELTGGNVACVSGGVEHLYHGPEAGRFYTTLYKKSAYIRFNPETDLQRQGNGLTRYSESGAALKQQVETLLKHRADFENGSAKVLFKYRQKLWSALKRRLAVVEDLKVGWWREVFLNLLTASPDFFSEECRRVGLYIGTLSLDMRSMVRTMSLSLKRAGREIVILNDLEVEALSGAEDATESGVLDAVVVIAATPELSLLAEKFSAVEKMVALMARREKDSRRETLTTVSVATYGFSLNRDPERDGGGWWLAIKPAKEDES